jgi:hypothetical protein
MACPEARRIWHPYCCWSGQELGSRPRERSMRCDMRHVWLSSLGAFLLAGNALAAGPPLYPETLATRPPLPSPTAAADERDLLVAFTAQGRWTVVPATPGSEERRRRYAEIDGHDFPTLARTGLHDPAELASTPTITDRSLAEITELGRPGRLSTDGFMADRRDEAPVHHALRVLRGEHALADGPHRDRLRVRPQDSRADRERIPGPAAPSADGALLGGAPTRCRDRRRRADSGSSCGTEAMLRLHHN